MVTMWEYQSSTGAWVICVPADCASIEAAYQSHCSMSRVAAVTLAGFGTGFNNPRRICVLGTKRRVYIINCEKMTQRHLLTWKKRALRRVLPTVTGQHVNDKNTHFAYLSAEKLHNSQSQRNSTSPHDSILPNIGSISSNDDEILVGVDESPWIPSDIDLPQPSVLVRTQTPFSIAVLDFTKYMHSETMALQTIQQIVDSMWLQEVVIQISAELFNVVALSAESIQHGTDADEATQVGYAKVAEVRESALMSVFERSANRSSVSLQGGLEYVAGVVCDRYAESLEFIDALLGQLCAPKRVAHVKHVARKQLRLLLEELQTINFFKEANTLTAMELEESISDVEEAECTFITSLVRVARANKQNVTLQQRVLRTLSQIVEVHAKNWRKEKGGKGECPETVSFVIETMQSEEYANASVQVHGCVALGCLAHCRPYRNAHAHGIQCVIDVMDVHMIDSLVLDKALFALRSIADQSVYNKIHMAKYNVIERVLKAMDSHPMDACLQLRGRELLGILVLAACVSCQDQNSQEP